MKALFAPASIALIGVSSDTEKISGRLLPILQGYGYSGQIYPVNPKRDEILGLKCYPSLPELPEIPDVAVLLVPNTAVPGVLEQAVERGVPYVMVYSSGFNEASDEGPKIAKDVQEILKGTPTRLVGPNSEGFYDVAERVALSFSPVIDPTRGRKPLKPGGTVIISQSGGIGFAIADQLESAGVGIRAVVTTGNELDLEVADFVRYYTDDPHVSQMVLFVEGSKDIDAWPSAFAAARQSGKRVIAIHIGRSPMGRKAVRAHTGKVSGELAEASAPGSVGSAAFQAGELGHGSASRTRLEIPRVFAETGVLQVADIDDLIEAALGENHTTEVTPAASKERGTNVDVGEAESFGNRDRFLKGEGELDEAATVLGHRIAIVSASGGGGIWCADLAAEYGLQVDSPSPPMLKELRAILPGYASLLNPIDVTAQAIFDGSIAQALVEILTSNEFDATLIVGTFGYDHKLIRDETFQSALRDAPTPVVVFSYTPPNEEAQSLFNALNVPWFTSPRRAVHEVADRVRKSIIA